MIKTLLSSALLTLALTSTVSADTVLRYAEGSPNRGARADAMIHFMKDAEQLSNGEVKFDIHWGGALLDYRATAAGVSVGTADLGTVLAAYDPQKLRALYIGDVPNKYSDPWVGMRAMYELMTTNKVMQDLLAQQNLVYVAGHTSTATQFECVGDNQIRTVADIKGKRIRAAGVYGKILHDLGANVVNLNAAEAYQALSTGLADCSNTYFFTTRAYKTHEVIDNFTIANWGQLTGYATVMNKDTWDDLSKKQQDALREAGRNHVDYYGKALLDEIELVTNGLRTGDIGNKVSVYEMAKEERAKLTKAGEKYANDWVNQINKDGVDAQKIWDEYHALLAKYQQEIDTKGYPWER
ncbi:MAG: C4-dicarboxylate TRAP transporter substrate-binding protein [Marinobacter sp.]